MRIIAIKFKFTFAKRESLIPYTKMCSRASVVKRVAIDIFQKKTSKIYNGLYPFSPNPLSEEKRKTNLFFYRHCLPPLARRRGS